MASIKGPRSLPSRRKYSFVALSTDHHHNLEMRNILLQQIQTTVRRATRSTHCPKSNLNLLVKTRSTHCPKSNLNLLVKTKPVYKSQIYTRTVASAPAVAGSVFMRRFRLFLSQCMSFMQR